MCIVFSFPWFPLCYLFISPVHSTLFSYKKLIYFICYTTVNIIVISLQQNSKSKELHTLLILNVILSHTVTFCKLLIIFEKKNIVTFYEVSLFYELSRSFNVLYK